jgi:hypothetical protein
MSKRLRKDIVIDANVMRLYDKPKDPVFKKLFTWLFKTGVLTVNQKLIIEYGGAGKPEIMILVAKLQREGRCNKISKSQISAFTKDRHFKYTCNFKDIVHAQTVFLSDRKRFLAFDKNLRKDINSFKKVNKIKSCACRNPRVCCLK